MLNYFVLLEKMIFAFIEITWFYTILDCILFVPILTYFSLVLLISSSAWVQMWLKDRAGNLCFVKHHLITEYIL